MYRHYAGSEVSYLAKKQNVIRYRRTFHFNIGFFIFLIIIVYVVFNIFSYINRQTIAEYEVTQGTIAANNIYRGLIIRDEELFYAKRSGYINYYLKNASKASSRDVVYSIDTDGTIAKQITKAKTDGSTLETKDLSKVLGELEDFAFNYDPNNYMAVYSFKSDLNSELAQALNTSALNELADDVDLAKKNKTFYQQKAGTAGIVLYYMDGLEDVEPADFTPDQVTGHSYRKTSLDSAEQIQEQDPVYKLVKSEIWNVIICISDELAQELNDGDTIRVRFCKDGFTANAGYTIVRREGKYYLNMELTTAMIRYATERYTDVELILEAREGLKIPNTAITTKDFFTVPKEYFSAGNDSNSLGVLRKETIDGEVKAVFVTPTIYYENEDAYYIDGEDISNGDVIMKNNSSETYTVGTDIADLEGVYNINKGYAVFKQINILFQNKEYSVVETKTAYGIALYDHIALDGSKIKENDFVTK